jgi:GTP cyclohydrolase I
MCHSAAHEIFNRYAKANPSKDRIRYVYGVPRGGCTVAAMVQNWAVAAKYKLFMTDVTHDKENTLIVDDLVDSGRTLRQWKSNGYEVDALFRKPNSPDDLAPQAEVLSGWLTFPWEINEGTGAEDLVVRLLQYVGEDPQRDGLKDTPRRVLKAWKDMTAGYGQDPTEILSKSFEVQHDELIMLRGIEFHSTCEHHLLPFYGTAAVGYIPTKTVVGISKLARLVECYARRLQIQERLTRQVADSIMDVIKPLGVGVVVKAKHACMGCRGVQKPDSDMVTSVTTGILRDDPRARAEFLSLVNL